MCTGWPIDERGRGVGGWLNEGGTTARRSGWSAICRQKLLSSERALVRYVKIVHVAHGGMVQIFAASVRGFIAPCLPLIMVMR